MSWEKCNEATIKVVTNICPHCHQELVMNKKVFANHVRWCKSNPNYEKIKKSTSEKLAEANRKNETAKKGELKDFTVNCCKCGKEIIVQERELEHPKKEKYYCSRNCANSHKYNDQIRNNISKGVKNYLRKIGKTFSDSNGNYNHICLHCHKEFLSKKSKQIFCSQVCSARHRKVLKYESYDSEERGRMIFELYKRQCLFKFSLNDFPEEYDFDLINEHGWYKAKNRGNNLYGVSRDHRFSIMEAFKLKINPYYISHPANCELILQSKNASKYKKCSISLEELKNNIIKWNKKYGEYKNKIDYLYLEEYIN